MEIIFWAIVIGVGAGILISVVNAKNKRDAADSASTEHEKHGFHATANVGEYLAIDDNRKEWTTKFCPAVFKYDDIIDFELVKNGEVTSTKNGLSRGVVGGLLFGVAGATVGVLTSNQKTVVNSLSVNIYTRHPSQPRVTISFLAGNTTFDTNSFVYSTMLNSAQDVIGRLFAMRGESEHSPASAAPAIQSASTADELLKFKQLLDAGAISPEEYEAQKKKLL